VNAEAIVGLVAALEDYLARDHDERAARWVEALEEIGGRLDTSTGLRWSVEPQTRHGMPIPCLEVVLPGDGPGPQEVAESLRRGDPEIWVLADGGMLVLSPQAMAMEDVELVAERLAEATRGNDRAGA
jgi:D-glucosaminate-6-phosphate ammonia-lyase